jgi:hypothetical protein
MKGIYMENDSTKVETVEDLSAAQEQEAKTSTSEGDELEDDENFMQLLDNLGGQNIFEE